ncbi:MAG: hypothetical protein RI894_1159, partial [Bacteroidota bacterium]
GLLMFSLTIKAQDISGDWEGVGSNGVLYSLILGQTNTGIVGIIHAEYAVEKGNALYYDGTFKGIFNENKLVKGFDKITATNASVVCQSQGVYTYKCDGVFEYLNAEMTPTPNFGNCQGFTIQYKRTAKEDCQRRACPAPTNIITKIIDTQTTDYQSIYISWDIVEQAKNYTVLFRKEGDASWQKQLTSLNNITLSQLAANTKYDIEVRSNCENINSLPLVYTFSTPKPVQVTPVLPPPPSSVDEQVNDIAQKLDRIVKIKHKITVKSDNLKIYVWDSGTLVDGDIISLYLNDIKVIDACILLRLKREYTVHLKKGTNIITSFAHNTGLVTPNTASILIDDGFSQQKIELNCTMNESEAIQIKR